MKEHREARTILDDYEGWHKSGFRWGNPIYRAPDGSKWVYSRRRGWVSL